MLTTPIQTTAFEITELSSLRLDPIRVHLHDFGPGKGRITIECYGQSWSACWGAMGEDRTVGQFFQLCDSDYLIQNLTQGRRLPKKDEAYLSRIVKAVQEALKTA